MNKLPIAITATKSDFRQEKKNQQSFTLKSMMSSSMNQASSSKAPSHRSQGSYLKTTMRISNLNLTGNHWI